MARTARDRIIICDGAFLKDASGPAVPCFPVLGGESLNINFSSGLGRVNELSVPNVDPDMNGPPLSNSEKDEVSRGKLIFPNRFPDTDELTCCSREIQAGCLAENVVDETTAIKAFWACAAKKVGYSNQGVGCLNDLFPGLCCGRSVV